MNSIDRLVIWMVLVVLGLSALRGVLEIATAAAVPVAIVGLLYAVARLWKSGKLSFLKPVEKKVSDVT